MNWLKHKLRTWLGLERDAANSERRDGTLDSMHRALDGRLRKLEEIVYAEQQAGADIAASREGVSHFILFGTYKGRDYVEVISVRGADFGELIEHARRVRRNSHGDFRVDAPDGTARHFRAALNRL